MTFLPRLMTRAELLIEQREAKFQQQIARGFLIDPLLAPVIFPEEKDHDCTGDCEDCCEHEFDPCEGFTCLNCGKQGELSDVYDEDYGQDR